MRLCSFFLIICLIPETAQSQEAGWSADVLIESQHGMGGAAI